VSCSQGVQLCCQYGWHIACYFYDKKVAGLNAIGYSLSNRCSVPVETDCDVWGLTCSKIRYLILYKQCSVPVKSVTAKGNKDNKNQTIMHGQYLQSLNMLGKKTQSCPLQRAT
jgi:hypothetical protein